MVCLLSPVIWLGLWPNKFWAFGKGFFYALLAKKGSKQYEALIFVKGTQRFKFGKASTKRSKAGKGCIVIQDSPRI